MILASIPPVSSCHSTCWTNKTVQSSTFTELVELLIDHLAELYENVPEDVTDIHGYTPLHIYIIQKVYCCMTDDGTSNSTVCKILASTSAPAMQDYFYQRCPLHWLCWNGQGEEEQHSHRSEKDGFRLTNSTKNRKNVQAQHNRLRIETLCILLDVYPDAMLICDKDGKTPLDIALENSCDPKFLSVIELATGKVIRNRQICRRNVFWSEFIVANEVRENDTEWCTVYD
jgi:hypothetical protein